MICTGELESINLDWKTRRPVIALNVEANAEDIEKLRGKKLTVELKKYRKKRSLDANAYYWTLVTKIADVIGNTMSFIHNDMLRKYGQIEVIDGQAMYLVIPDTEEAQKCVDNAETYHLKPTSQVKVGKDGKLYRTYMMLKGSHEYDTKEMSVLIEGIISEAKELGIETMTPKAIEEMMALYEQHHSGRHN